VYLCLRRTQPALPEVTPVPRHLVRLIAITACLLALPASVRPAKADDDTVPRSLLVKTRAHGGRNGMRSILVRAGLDRRAERWRSKLTRWHAVTVAPGVDIAAAVEALSRDPAVESVEVEKYARVTVTPDDLDPGQWALDNTGQVVNGSAGLYDADIDAPEAWELSRGDRSVIVAVLDTGVHTDHPDLQGNLMRGYDFASGDGDTWDDAGAGHGTPVAGIIGAVGDNGTAMAGVNWQVSLLPVKVCDGAGRCPYSAIVAGVEYAVAHGARILNLSLSCDEHLDDETGSCDARHPGECYSGALRDALEAAGHAGALAVTAAGNCGQDVDDDTKVYPCAYDLDNVLCVGATDSRDELAWFSNYGPAHVKVAAPGTEMLSLSTSPSFTLLWDGTSFSAPLAAGVAALELSRNDHLTPGALVDRMAAARPLASLDGSIAGGSRLNAHTAVSDLFLTPRAVSGSTGGSINLTGDFDGDGWLDACEADRGGGHRVARGNGVALATPTIWSTRAPAGWELVGDYDGDGRDDIAQIGRGGIDVLLSSGAAFGPARRWSSSRLRLLAAWTGDVDGDGRADIVLMQDRRRVLVQRSGGAGFGRPELWATMRSATPRLVADMNGDGKADLVWTGRDGLGMSSSTGGAFGGPVLLGPEIRRNVDLLAGDVDGDGVFDLASRRSDGCWDVMLSNGAGLLPGRPWGCAPGDRYSALGAFDADGRADLITLDPTRGWQVSRSSR